MNQVRHKTSLSVHIIFRHKYVREASNEVEEGKEENS